MKSCVMIKHEHIFPGCVADFFILCQLTCVIDSHGKMTIFNAILR